MPITEISNIIENFDILSIDEKEYVLKIIEKSYTEAKRDLLIARVYVAMENLKNNNVKRGSLHDLFEDLENG